MEIRKKQTFLQITNSIERVKEGFYFSDRQMFLDPTETLLDEIGKGRFTDQGTFKKKMLTKESEMILN